MKRYSYPTTCSRKWPWTFTTRLTGARRKTVSKRFAQLVFNWLIINCALRLRHCWWAGLLICCSCFWSAVWLSLQGPSLLVADRGSVPFLPVNSEFSATRNQARQKLGRLNAREFATLLIDLLCEAKRRQMGGIASLISGKLSGSH